MGLVLEAAEYKERRASEVSDEECEYVKTKKPNLIDSLRRNGDKCTMQLQFARSVVSCGFPFSRVENEHFKKFSELMEAKGEIRHGQR